MLLYLFDKKVIRDFHRLFDMDAELRHILFTHQSRRYTVAEVDALIRTIHFEETNIRNRLFPIGQSLTNLVGFDAVSGTQAKGTKRNKVDQFFGKLASHVVLGPQWLVKSASYDMTIHQKKRPDGTFRLELRLLDPEGIHVLADSDDDPGPGWMVSKAAATAAPPKLKIKRTVAAMTGNDG